MEHTQSKLPSKVTEGVTAKCNRCGSTIYNEYFETTPSGVERFFIGSYRQKCDDRGNPTGAVIPFCKCKENTNA